MRVDVTAFQYRLDEFCQQYDGELPLLTSSPPANLDSLLARLGDLPRAEQSAVVRFVAQTKHRTAVPALLKFLPTASASIAEEMAQVIATQGGDQAGPILIDILAAGNIPVTVRRSVVYALVWLFDPRAIPLLMSCCQDVHEDPVIRTTAAEGLMYLARDLEQDSDVREQVESTFLAGLQDSQVEVRYWSVYAVGGMKIRAALPMLAQMAQQDVGYDTTHDCWIRDEALEAMRLIDPACKLPTIQSPLGSQAKIA